MGFIRCYKNVSFLHYYTIIMYTVFTKQETVLPAPAPTGAKVASPIQKNWPLGSTMAAPIICLSYTYPVEMVVFDANNHEAN